MNCPSCGQANSSTARFCDQCGTRLTDNSGESKTLQQELGISTSFIGRQQEMRELMSALGDVLSGNGRLVMLAGEPGIGKTRTAQELASVAEKRGFQVLWGRCFEEQGTPPYWPWVQIIRAHIREQGPERLRSVMGGRASDIAQVVSEVSEILPDLEPPLQFDSPEQARFRLFDSITSFLNTTSRQQPLLLVLDDLHWADEPSLLLLQFLARELESGKLMVLATYRDVELSRQHPLAETLGELTRGRLLHRLHLRRWDQEDVSQFMRVSTTRSLSPEITREVYSQTEGNPLFVAEMLRLLDQDAELPAGRVGPEALRLPEGVREVIGRRLNRLSPGCNDVLTVASAIGREFTLEQLGSLIEGASEDDLLGKLEEALVSRVIEELPRRVGNYQFTHALIQETLLDELSTTRRVRLHARIAEALEELYGADAESHSAELAHHFCEAEGVLGGHKLAHYSSLAGERALFSYAWEEALIHFRNALAAKGTALEDRQPASDQEEAALLFGLGRAQVATLQRTQMGVAGATLARAFDYYKKSGDVEQALNVANFPFFMGGDFRPLVMPEVLAQALELVPPDSLQAGRLLARYGTALGPDSDTYPVAKKAFQDALVIAQREGDTRLEIRVLVNSARLHGFYLEMEECLANTSRALELLKGIDDPVSEVPAYFWSSRVRLGQGDLLAAQTHAAAAVAPAEREGFKTLRAIACWTNVPAASMAGNWETARDFARRGLGLVPTEGLLLSSAALIEYQLGHFGQGDVYLDRILEGQRINNSSLGVSMASGFLAIPLAAGITGSTKGLEVVENVETQSPLAALTIRAAKGLVAVLGEDTSAAHEHYDALRSSRIGEWVGLMSTDRLLGLLSVTMENPEQAAHHFEDGLSFCRNAGYRPELAWTCHDYAALLKETSSSGNQDKARTLVEEGLAISTELGMIPLMERITGLQNQVSASSTLAPAYPDGLSRREVEVLRLVAAGKNNREIAEELVVSVGTVANHVTSILNKAALNNRTEAAGYAIRQRLTE